MARRPALASRASAQGRRHWAGLASVTLVGLLASGAVLYVKEVSEQAIHGMVAGQAARTQLQVIDGLEWRAISGRVPPAQIEGEIHAPAERMRASTSTSAASGLDGLTARRLVTAQDRYLALVRQELALLATGDGVGAEELDEAGVDPAFELVSTELTRAGQRLEQRARVLEWVSNGGVMLIVFVALVMAARVQHRRRVADAHRAAERRSEARYRALIEQSSDVVLVTDRSGKVSFSSPAVERLLAGQQAQHPVGHVGEVLHPEDRQTLLSMLSAGSAVSASDDAVRVDVRLGAETVGWRQFELALRDLSDVTGVAGLVLTGRDVTERHGMQQEMTYRALHDALTGLPNRLLMADRFEHALRTDRRRRADVAGGEAQNVHTGLLLIDLDRFKEINDTLGHHVGDDLLTQVGPRLVGALREVDTVSRLGGDEFAVLLPELRDLEDAVTVARKVQAALVAPYRVYGLELHVEASIGVVLSGVHGDDVATLLQRADVAMYAAKNQHVGVSVYSPASDENSPDRLALLADLRQALDRNELVLHFQPQVALTSGEVSGAEALVRWNHPTRGQLAPDVFIPLAEHTGLIGPLTYKVLDLALTQARRWLVAGQPLPISVNLSVRNLLDDDLDRHLAALLQDHRVPAQLLVLEVTESAIMTDPDRATATLHRLHGLGVRISLDDFGSGYTSLRQLKSLPVDEIKVDRSFVMTMSDNPGDQVIVRSVIDLGHNLGLSTVAEGVETADDLRSLTGYGCDVAQGYLLSRPLPAAEFDRWRASRGSVPDQLPAPPRQPPAVESTDLQGDQVMREQGAGTDDRGSLR